MSSAPAGSLLCDGIGLSAAGDGEAAEALMREESQSITGEVMRIKEAISKKKDYVETKIGRAVNPWRKHDNKDIRLLVRALINGWKVKVDEWLKTTAAVTAADSSPDSINPSVVDDDDDGGLPSPPLEEEAFNFSSNYDFQFSEIFDGLDDDGNCIFFVGDSCGKSTSEGTMSSEEHELKTKEELLRQQVVEEKPEKPHPTPNSQFKLDTQDVSIVEKSKLSDELSIQAKLELSKRKLREGYQLAENAKRKRRIQLVELHDLPLEASKKLHDLPKCSGTELPAACDGEAAEALMEGNENRSFAGEVTRIKELECLLIALILAVR
ncbi:putative mediator of RNA polymerase II transcription subunit 26b [Apostasia shenzhenica]|uniref:Putative mediator of RNA polymerase II transcription subunit 26b n=1 Tax=Apostasia shenzhenica TaxID=1088818 RepID=A0A2I0BGB7_9ASPA|nr:putative mediator of RNA polymerase II transcription subunit 26b [Apostasia shenzhenica]